jgi:hypothetical protein
MASRLTNALSLFTTHYRGLPVVEHGGALFGYPTAILRFPDERSSVICSCNLAGATPESKARQAADLFVQSVDLPGGHAPVVPDLRVWAGLYRDPKERIFLAVTARDGGVDPAPPNETTQVLKQDGNGRFVDSREHSLITGFDLLPALRMVCAGLAF